MSPDPVEPLAKSRLSIFFFADIFSLLFIGSLSIIISWSCVCVWGVQKLKHSADKYPNTKISDWMEWIEETQSMISVIGGLFTFSLVFRFNRCYDRWWEGRVIWGNITTTTLNVALMNRAWIVDRSFADRLSRFLVVFVYACKAQLRNQSLGDPDGDGMKLIEKGYLNKSELDDMEQYPCWQPLYVLDIMHTIIAQVCLQEEAQIFHIKHPVFKETFKFFENSLSLLSQHIGDALRVRSAGMPKSYDSMHHIFFYFYFTLAPISYASTMGWALPIIITVLAMIIMVLMTMGSALVDPFGTDVVDLPLDNFCSMIEVQLKQIDERSFREEKMKFATESVSVPIRKYLLKARESYQINLKG